MAGQLLLSDVTPGLPAPQALDWDSVTRQLNDFEAKLNSLRPIVKRNGGLFALYQLRVVIVQAPEAQMILDYCEAFFPKGTKVRWIIIPQPQPVT